MLDYTKAAIKQVGEDFKKVDFARNIITQIIYLLYLVYAMIFDNGIFAVNITLFVLSAAYFAFFMFVTVRETKKEVHKVVKTIYTRCKQIIKLFTLGVMLYGVWLTTENVTPLSVILSALMIVGWVLQIVFEILIKFFTKRINLLLEGLEADYENMTKPARTVGSFFKKITGNEVEEKEPSKARLLLDKKVEEAKAEKKNAKLEKKYLKKQAKIEEKERKKQERLQKKAAKNGTAIEEVAVTKR